MKSASSGNRTIVLSIFRLAVALAIIIVGFASAPDLRAEIPPDQIKAAGAIPLTTDLLDKMDKFIKSISTDEAAKAEIVVVGKDPNMTPETWGISVSSKCPKAAAIFKSAGITPDEFSKGIFAIMAVAMAEELSKSEDKAVKDNADFVAANKDKCDAVFAGFMMLDESGPSSSPVTP
jgi:hypothetical protein